MFRRIVDSIAKGAKHIGPYDTFDGGPGIIPMDMRERKVAPASPVEKAQKTGAAEYTYDHSEGFDGGPSVGFRRG